MVIPYTHHHHHQKVFRNKSHTFHGERPGGKWNKGKCLTTKTDIPYYRYTHRTHNKLSNVCHYDHAYIINSCAYCNNSTHLNTLRQTSRLSRPYSESFTSISKQVKSAVCIEAAISVYESTAAEAPLTLIHCRRFFWWHFMATVRRRRQR